MARPNQITMCSFCGKSRSEVKKLIAGPGVYICDCVRRGVPRACSAKELRQESQAGTAALPAWPKPAEIKRRLDEHVIGQDDAKRDPQRRRLQPLQARAEPGVRRRLPKAQDEVELAEEQRPARRPHRLAARRCWRRRIAQLLDVPFAIADATVDHRGRLRGRGRGEHHPAPASECRLRREDGPRWASFTSTRSTRSRARPKTCPSPATCPARACSRRC
jgi:hypothetical protein